MKHIISTVVALLILILFKALNHYVLKLEVSELFIGIIMGISIPVTHLIYEENH
jgi:hypothetical protein